MDELETLSGHLIICGLGHVGYRIHCLLRQLGEESVVITLETADERRLQAEVTSPILVGDARDERLLRKAGIERAKAILAVTSDDLANVSIALDAGRLNPQITIVTRLFDQHLAKHLEEATGISRALSASALAMPHFMEAVVGSGAHPPLEIQGTPFLFGDSGQALDPSWAGKTLQKWSKQTGRTVLRHRRGEAATVFPPQELSLQEGDRLTTISPSTEPHSPGEIPTRKARQNGTGLHISRTFLIGLREWWRESPQSIRRALVAFAFIVIFSVGVFHYALGLRMIDAFYFVITTVTTVGYGDLSLVNAPPLLKLYGTFLMLCGAALLATLFSIITDLVLKTRLRDVLARGCSRYKGHIIVADLENLGFRLAKELAQSGETVVAIDSSQESEFAKAARETASVIIGNARTEETLLKAGITGAKVIVAAGADDLENLSIGLAAKKANPGCRVVLRVFDSALAGKMQQRLGFDSVMSVSACAAPDFVGAALYPGANHAILLDDGLLAIRSETVGSTDAQAEDAGLFVKPGRGPMRGHREEAHLPSPAASQRPPTAGGSEHNRFVAFCPETKLEPGDEVIRARWFPLKPSDP